MTKSLEEWHGRLHHHFSTLEAKRELSGLPIFALEHGLSSTEINAMEHEVRMQIRQNKLSSKYWLPCAVYAAEQGYTYDGHEYWQSFEKNTLGWREHYGRESVSTWFKKFQKKYNSVAPSGPWANHFRIIAQPITHAIIPLYLQEQFVRVLYYLRFDIARLIDEAPQSIGQAVSANVSYGASARFGQFLEQEELVSRIAVALINKDIGDSADDNESILPQTLQRIIDDLGQVQDARKWLQETSSVVKNRFKGIGQGSGPRSTEIETVAERQSRNIQRYSIRPRLGLRHSSDNRWQLIIDVQNFKEVAALNRDLYKFLAKTRCSLNGDTVKRAGGWTLSGNRRAVLKQWPVSGRPLIEFEQNNDLIDNLLGGEFHMKEGGRWLFRMQQDGSAQEITGEAIVQPGRSYILISEKPFNDNSGNMKPCIIECEGVCAVLISVPPEVSQEYKHWLRENALALKQTIRVWPAGLAGRNWDGMGCSDWLSNEKLCIAVAGDHPVNAYLISIDDNHETRVEPTYGRPTFVQLTYLEPGNHVLRVKAERTSPTDKLLEGYLELNVLEPRTWIPDAALHAGLVVTGDPYDATLDVFWENDYNLEILGPNNQQMALSVALKNAKGEKIFQREVCPAAELPVKSDWWRQQFGAFLRKHDCSDIYPGASSGLLKIDAYELGQYYLKFNHDVLPVRWIQRRSGKNMSVRLFDDTEQDKTKCFFFDIKKPAAPQILDYQGALKGVTVENPGGLYAAENNSNLDAGIEAAIVVSSGATDCGFQGLGVSPNYTDINNIPLPAAEMLRLLRLWREARSIGPVTNVRRNQVVEGIIRIVHCNFFGDDWMQAENTLFERCNGCIDVRHTKTIMRALWGRETDGFLDAIENQVADLSGKNINGVSNWFRSLAQKHKVCDDALLCSFAVDLAGAPYKLALSTPGQLEELTGKAENNQNFLRSARFAALLCICKNGAAGSRLPQWRA